MASSVGGVTITHPERSIYPELGISKIQFARYFEAWRRWGLSKFTSGIRPLNISSARTDLCGISIRCWYVGGPAMPFKSQAQRRKFAQLLVEGKISNDTFEEWNRETGGKKLPERVKASTRGRRPVKRTAAKRTNRKRRR